MPRDEAATVVAPEPAAEGVARRRFTFAPKGEARALVEGAAGA